MTRLVAASLLVLVADGGLTAVHDPRWKPAPGPLRTRWASRVTGAKPLPEYPRPTLVRKEWRNLNGLWEYAIRARGEGKPGVWDGRILVPFPVESSLSGVARRVGPDERLWYRLSFRVPGGWSGRRVMLHFGAVDWEAEVWVNGEKAGKHRGGYDPFSFDVTESVEPGRTQELVVAVWDPTDTGSQPHGKQFIKPEGIWYTPTTGIWQTVWMEPVPGSWVKSVRVEPDLKGRRARVTVAAGDSPTGAMVTVTVLDGKKAVGSATGKPGEELVVPVGRVKTWSPDSPHLYGLKVELAAGDGETDRVTGYFGMREVGVAKGADGIPRLVLNGKPVFQFGPLDQGFWPDGLYTAPTDEALKSDVAITKKLGFNMARKHVKVEPERWYYWCDRLGLLVWQDMPSAFPDGRAADGGAPGDGARDRMTGEPPASIFERELHAMIEARRAHPSIVMWVPFNEGWGQYDTARIAKMVKEQDPGRLVNCASGWDNEPGAGDVRDIHDYPGPSAPPPEPVRASVLGEFGGLGLPVKGHTWQTGKNWGYRSFADAAKLASGYERLIWSLRLLAAEGLSAAVYTQTTDVEIEVNGLLTYDRALVKMGEARVARANRALFLPVPRIVTVVPTSEEKPQEWTWTTTAPGTGWEKPGYADSGWNTGPGGFGTEGTPGAIIGTRWDTPDIWLRRTVRAKAFRGAPFLRIHHDDDAEVFLNGVLAATLKGYRTAYAYVALEDAAKRAVMSGKVTIAIHCHQEKGGQFIDAGLYAADEKGAKRR